MPQPADPRIKLVRLKYAAYNNRDIDGVLATLHPDVEIAAGDERGQLHEREIWRGHAEVRGLYEMLLGEGGLVWVEIAAMAIESDRLVARMRLHDQDSPVGAAAVHVYWFEEDLIRRVEAYRRGPSFPGVSPA